MKRIDFTVCKKCVYTALALLLVMGPVSAAGDNPSEIFDVVFWFRALMTGMLSVLIWLARNTDSRLKEVENKSIAQLSLNAARDIVLQHSESRLQLVEHEQKQIVSLIGMQREMLLTKYHDKEETERHRQHVEATLENIGRDIRDLNERFNTLGRRRSDN